MKIYVDELPKNCKECPLYRSGKLKIQKCGRYIDADTCVLGNFYKFQEIDNEIDTCPLQTTQSLKQQVREEVCDEIRKKGKYIRNKDWFGQYSGNNGYFVIGDNDLNQIQGENNVKD